MKIDVKGYEKKVLQGSDFKKYRPKILIIESIIPMSQEQNHKNWEELLVENDYIFAYFDGLNNFYIANEHLHLKEHFLLPVNVFDEVVTHDTLLLQKKNRILSEKSENKSRELDDKSRELDDKSRELDAVYNSKSWKVTKPLRKFRQFLSWIVHVLLEIWRAGKSSKLLRSRLVSVAKCWVISLLRFAARYVLARPRLKRLVLKILNRIPKIRECLVKKLMAPAPIRLRYRSPSVLSPRAQKLYIDLQAAIEKNQEVE